MRKKHTTKTRKPKWITAAEFDRMADNGEDITPYLDLKNVITVHVPIYRVNVDFPAWMVKLLDKEATKLNVSRQSVIKMWINDRLSAAKPARKK